MHDNQNLRQRTQANETTLLSPLACLSANTRGRQRAEKECDVRTPFQRDIDRIVYCNSFRRLKHKTQVFLRPEGDHYRTRMTHTLEVSRIARTIARALGLNEDLTEAVALGHDLGHTPFGHAGERALDAVMPNGFTHYRQSLRVVEVLEKKGAGLNLTHEVRDGILCHTGGTLAQTLEGQVVRFADKIAYLNHDIEDALRAGVIYPMDIPLGCSEVLGYTHGERINRLVVDIITASDGQNEIRQTQTVGEAMASLRRFMFSNVYTNPLAKGEEGKAQDMLQRMFTYYQKNPDQLPADFQTIVIEDGADRAICDYIAGMTDPFAVEQFHRLFVPNSWTVK